MHQFGVSLTPTDWSGGSHAYFTVDAFWKYQSHRVVDYFNQLGICTLYVLTNKALNIY
ncbi:MAG: hypothetical protein RLY95_1137 [Pseudomonadota bacterium]|jgi:hypothetical protein